jgi:hypothetical protein
VRFAPTDEKPLKDVMEKIKLERSPQKLNKKIREGGQKVPMLHFQINLYY